MELGPIVRDASQLRKKLTEGLSRKECMGLARDLLNGEPHCFHGSTSHFDSVRQYLAEALGVDEDAVALVGSGQNGFSLAPANNLRPFHPDSDLDFAIVSSSLFDEYCKRGVEGPSELFSGDHL